MPSFLDYLDIPALQQAVQQTRAIQVEKHLAVQPKPVLASLGKEALQRAEAGRTLALGERRLGLGTGALDLTRRRVALEGQRLDLVAQKAAFERGLEPYALGVEALGVGANVLGALRTAQGTRRAEERAVRVEQRGEEQLRLQAEQTEASKRKYGALELLLKNPTYYSQGP